MDTTARILIVDDEPRVLASLRLHLCRDYTVLSTSDPHEAVEMLKKGEVFDVIMTDMRMPGMDGVELLKAARKLAPSTIRILLTGYANLQSAISAVNDGGVFRLLTKPCAPPVVLDAVADAVKQRKKDVAARHVQNTVGQALRDGHAGALALHVGKELSNVATVYSSVLYMVRGAVLSKDAISKHDLEDLGWVENQIRKQAEQLISLASADEETFAHVDLHLLVRDVVDTLREVSGFAEIDEDFRDAPKAYVVPAKARRVLTRLIANAVHAAQKVPFGCVKIRITHVPQTAMVQCDIMDNGVGEASGTSLSIPEWLGHTEKTDFGAIRNIVDELNGQIFHSSSPRRGTVFSVVLPTGASQSLADDDTSAESVAGSLGEPQTISFLE